MPLCQRQCSRQSLELHQVVTETQNTERLSQHDTMLNVDANTDVDTNVKVTCERAFNHYVLLNLTLVGDINVPCCNEKREKSYFITACVLVLWVCK